MSKIVKRPSIFEEYLLQEPDYHPWCDVFIEAIQDNFWTHRLYTFQTDVQDFKTKLSEQERDIVVKILALISQIEISVKRFWARHGDNCPHPNIISLGYWMAANEVVHEKAYKNLLKVMSIKDEIAKILDIDIVRNRVNYLNKHVRKYHSDNKKQYVYSLILFTLIIENLALFSQFYVINWFNRVDNVLKDTNKQVMYTSREETIHSEVGIRSIHEIKLDHPELFDEELEQKVIKEAKDFIKHEWEILQWVLGDYNREGDDGEGLSAEILQEMSKNRLNISLKKIGYNEIFEINHDLLKKTEWFDKQLIAPIRTDFFQERPSEYGVGEGGFEEGDLF